MDAGVGAVGEVVGAVVDNALIDGGRGFWGPGDGL